MSQTLNLLEPGQEVRVVQTIHRREGAWTTAIQGTILEILDAQTGSWYAHSANDRYWLRRIRLRKTDGEVTLLSLDPDSLVTLVRTAEDQQPSAT